eukprot:COSAG04_NODE_2002_length_5029_cov_5.314604_2_plen_185_part_00
MMAEYAGVDYEAKLHDSDTDEWAELKAELIKTNPLANLPYVIDGDTVVTQSNACFAYLGEKFGLLGSDATERVQCEQCLCQVMDLRNEAIELFYGRGVSVSPGGISPAEHGAAYRALPPPSPLSPSRSQLTRGEGGSVGEGVGALLEDGGLAHHRGRRLPRRRLPNRTGLPPVGDARPALRPSG